MIYNCYISTEEFYPGVQNELEMFYFVSECTSLTPVMKTNIRRAFIKMLQERGICRQVGIRLHIYFNLPRKIYTKRRVNSSFGKSFMYAKRALEIPICLQENNSY